MNPTKKYQPISCIFYDHLLEKATFKETVKIVYQVEQQELELETIIIDVYTKESVEYLKTKEQHIIRLDHLISVGSKKNIGGSCTIK